MRTFKEGGEEYPLDSKYAKLMAGWVMSPIGEYAQKWESDGKWELWRNYLVKNRVELDVAKAMLAATDYYPVRGRRDLDYIHDSVMANRRASELEAARRLLSTAKKLVSVRVPSHYRGPKRGIYEGFKTTMSGYQLTTISGRQYLTTFDLRRPPEGVDSWRDAKGREVEFYTAPPPDSHPIRETLPLARITRVIG